MTISCATAFSTAVALTAPSASAPGSSAGARARRRGVKAALLRALEDISFNPRAPAASGSFGDVFFGTEADTQRQRVSHGAAGEPRAPRRGVLAAVPRRACARQRALPGLEAGAQREHAAQLPVRAADSRPVRGRGGAAAARRGRAARERLCALRREAVQRAGGARRAHGAAAPQADRLWKLQGRAPVLVVAERAARHAGPAVRGAGGAPGARRGGAQVRRVQRGHDRAGGGVRQPAQRAGAAPPAPPPGGGRVAAAARAARRRAAAARRRPPRAARAARHAGAARARAAGRGRRGARAARAAAAALTSRLRIFVAPLARARRACARHWRRAPRRATRQTARVRLTP
ncbi:hypothetical protein FGB62_6g322 [Gracilaria domingensis]|nr:hypothetical protein FGB62_6g322 [Gracilaria domingensis]